MCGIAGFTQNARNPDDGVIRRMTSTLVHRGPDQQGCCWTQDVALGAVRLRVIDLDGGEQPMRTPSGAHTIVYNGEIYNFAALRQELEALGHRFLSQCDTEVALHAFAEWDTGCFRRFRGMFAMAIWSETAKRLVLARDRIGIKPLYVSRVGRDIVFGSELKALLAHPRVTRRLDLQALSDFLSLNYVPGPRTLIEGIRKLQAGHYLEWRDGVTTVLPWWELKFAPDARITEDDAAEELDKLLRDAVREHMISDVPLGIWASGGLDSSTLLHYAAEAGGAPLKTFSIAFASPSCDERKYFREIASVYGTQHHEFELGPEVDLPRVIEEFAWYSDEPGADAGALPLWFLSKMSRRHVTVALSGEGGDELFGGYLTYRADQLARPLRRTPGVLRRAALAGANALLPVSDAKIGFEYKVKRFLEGSLLPPDEAHLFWNGTFSAKQKRRLMASDFDTAASLARLGRGISAAGLNRYLMFDQQYYLPDNLLYKVDRMSMAHSLEVRPPLLDHRIVEFAARLPEKLKIDGAYQKVILKRVMRDKLPPRILNRGKAGLDIPAHEWFRGPLAKMAAEVLAPETVAATGLFDPAETSRLMVDHRERRINAGYHLWGLLTLFTWLKRWDVEIAPAGDRAATEPSGVLAAAN
jgi:asparagine synthase (glutamine-hydrolysing)